MLALAAEAEGVNPIMTSNSFWCDDIWQKKFSKAQDKYELSAAQGIEADSLSPFIYPFSLTWRIPFQSYFLSNSGVLEFSHMPTWLVHLVSVHNGYILIDHSVEALMSDTELNAMFAYFHKGKQLPMYKIIYLTGAVNSSSVYEKFCEKFDIDTDRSHRMHVIPYASAREIFHNFYINGHRHHDDGDDITEPVYDTEYLPTKLFLSWNRRFRRHRISLALLLEKHKLIERSLVSFAKIDGEMSHNTIWSEIEKMHPDLEDTCCLYGSHELAVDSETIRRFATRCPLIIDGETDNNKMCEDNGHTQAYYKDTLVSLITETNYDVPECTLTEKSFKPLFNKHPFILIGVPGSVQGLRDLGFKTFGEFWSEDYDTVEDPGERFVEIEKILLEISSWTPEEVLDFKRRVKPILEYNYHMFKEPGSLAVVNNIYEHITNNFNTDYSHWCNPQGGCHFDKNEFRPD
tara:strand:- start:38 stop:1417 length:1380 start_codon:yes stop_codon:yes gene_type:complete